MNRNEAIAYLNSTYAEMQAATEITATDTSAGYLYVLNSALRSMGYAESDLATASVDLVETYTLWLDYHALSRFIKAFATAVDVAVESPNVQKKRNQLFTNAKALLEMAKDELIAAGLAPGGWEVGRLNLDFLEPVGGVA